MSTQKSVLESSGAGRHSRNGANHGIPASLVPAETASVVPFQNWRPTAPPLVAARVNPAAAGPELLMILLVSTTALACYFEASRIFAVHISHWVMLAIFIAAIISGVAGFAFSAICGAMLFHLLPDPIAVVETMIVSSIAIQCMSVITLKNTLEPWHLSRFLAGGIVGLPIGIYLLTHISGSIYIKCMGVFLVGYGAYMLFRKPMVVGRGRCAGDYLAGFLGGITGGFAAFPGAFVTIWCGLKGLPKDQQRGVYQPFILIMQVLALAALFFVQSAHRSAQQIDPSTIAYIPAALLGTWCGIAIFRRLTDVQFAWSVNLLLVVSGLGLVC
jgi:uncharacterized membrane protein YfcA